MSNEERRGKIDELKHLLKYHRQATHEFFDDAEHGVLESADTLFQYLERGGKDPGEIRKLMSCLETSQKDIKNRLGDLDYLINRMTELVNSLFSGGE